MREWTYSFTHVNLGTRWTCTEYAKKYEEKLVFASVLMRV